VIERKLDRKGIQMLSLETIEAAIRNADGPSAAAKSVLDLLDADVGFVRHGMNPQAWETIVAGSMTGLIFQGLLLKLEELERLAAEPCDQDWIRQAREFDRDRCIETIEHVAGAGRSRLAEEAIETVRNDLKLAAA